MIDSRIALLDVDGVVADFSNHLLTAVGSDKTIEDVTCWHIFDFMTNRQEDLGKSLLKDPEFWSGQPVIKGAYEGVVKIREAGFKIIWATSPWFSCVEWAHVRRNWLRERFGAADDEIMIGDQKGLLRGDLFIDDKPEHVFAWESTNGSGSYIFNAPYNQGHDWPRLFGWSDIDRVLADAWLKETA